MLFEYHLGRDKSKCLLCGKWMNDGNEKRHLINVHKYSEIDATIEALKYTRHQLKLVNGAIWNKMAVAPQ